MELSDRALLDRYAAQQDEAAFRLLVERHVNFVHALARRVTSNDELARDVAQTTFIRLAERAALVPSHLSLTAWLHRVCRHLAIDAVRAEHRRKNRERLQSPPMEPTREPAWAELAPVIDQLVESLPAVDRQVLLLRYYRDEPHAAIARELGLSEDAVKKRARRALEKLRGMLAKSGVATSATVLASVIPAHASQPAPGFLTGKIVLAAKSHAPLTPGLVNSVMFGAGGLQQGMFAAAVILFLGSLSWSIRPAAALPPAGGVTAAAPKTVAIRSNEGKQVSALRTSEERVLRLKEILAIPGYVRRSREMLDFVNLLSAPQLDELARTFQKTFGYYHSEEFATLLSAWARLDPQPVCEFVFTLGYNDLFGLPVGIWAVKDPAAAVAWAYQYPDEGTINSRSYTAVFALNTIVRTDPAGAFRLLRESSKDDEKLFIFIASLMMRQIPRLPERLDELLASIDDPACQEMLIQNAASQVVDRDPKALLDLFAEHPERVAKTGLSGIFGQIARRDEDEALALLRQLPGDAKIGQAVEAIISNGADLPQGLALLEEFPEVANDDLYQRAISAIVVKDPAVGAEYLDRIQDEKLRETTSIDCLRKWMKLDPRAAWTWLDTHPVPDAVRNHFESP